jgi:hypothetical protein
MKREVNDAKFIVDELAQLRQNHFLRPKHFPLVHKIITDKSELTDAGKRKVKAIRQVVR